MLLRGRTVLLAQTLALLTCPMRLACPQSSNILLTAGGTAKLGDVGLSRLQQRTFLSDVAAVGTFDYAAPEVLLGGTECTAAVDLYSFGGAQGKERDAEEGSQLEGVGQPRQLDAAHWPLSGS